MPMPPYPIYCITPGCKNLAGYKIASQWSDGVQRELKTFALSCEGCLAKWFQASRAKAKGSRLTANETLDPPGIYRLERGLRDRALERLEDLERKLAAPLAGA
jgi:hypothetical protein